MKLPSFVFETVLATAFFAALTGIPAEPPKNFQEAAKAVSQKLSANDFAAAKEAAETALGLAKNPNEKATQKLLCAQIAQRSGENEQAIKLFGELFAEQSAPRGLRIQAQDSIGDMLLRQKKYPEAREAYQKLFELKDANDNELRGFYFSIARVYNEEKRWDDARREYDKALELKGLRPADRFDVTAQKAGSFEREKRWDDARKEYAKISTDKELDKNWQLRAGLASAKTFSGEKDFRQAVEAYGKLLELPGLENKDCKNIYDGIADVYLAQKDWTAARQEYARMISLPDLNDNDKISVQGKIVDSYRMEGNLKCMEESMGILLKMPGQDAAKVSRLIAQAELALRYKEADSAIAAYGNAFELAGNDVKNRDKAYSALLDLLAQKGDLVAAKKLLGAAVSDKLFPVTRRFEAQAILLSLNAAEQKKAFPKNEIEAAGKEYETAGLSGAEKLNALQDAAKFFVRTFDYKNARELMQMGDALLVKPQRKAYTCRYMENAPLGAGGWFLSNMLKDDKFREGRFGDYDKASASMLFTDATTDRVVAEDKGKAYYFENTAFYMVYDKAGWHMFVLSGEQNAEQILADGVGSGSLEMYFSPGYEGQTYYQWIIELPKGEASVYDWNSPHRYFRPLADSLKTETLARDKAWGTYIFIPWEVLYDKLPFDHAGGKWPFGFIRWSPSGGLTWGGKVHEIGKWGLVEWEKPAAKDEAVIKKNILRKAWGKYKKDRAAQQTFWADKVLGDLDFYNKSLLPAIEKLNKLGEPMQAPDKLSDEDVLRLYKEAISDWMEFDYLTSELRRSYLENNL